MRCPSPQIAPARLVFQLSQKLEPLSATLTRHPQSQQFADAVGGYCPNEALAARAFSVRIGNSWSPALAVTAPRRLVLPVPNLKNTKYRSDERI